MARKVTATEVGYDQIKGLNIKVDSPEWFQWLEDNRSFHYSCSQGHFTANKNSKGYWYAQRRSEGNLLQHYLGQTSKLTLEVLRDAASKLALAAIDNRPSNRLVKTLEEQSCKSCMTEEERLRQSSKGELIDLVVHLKEKLQDYKTEHQATSQVSPPPEDFKETTLLRECLESHHQQKHVIEAYRSETEELNARIIELEQLNSELQATNQSLEKQLCECSLQKADIQQAYDREADCAKRYYPLWRKYPDLERKNKRLQEQVDAFEAAPLKILDGWIEAANIDLKPRTADKLRAYREYLLRSSREDG